MLARCVGDIAAFEADHWGQTPLLCRAGAGGGFPDVLTIEDLDAFLASGIRRPVVRLVQDGSPLPEGRYTTRVRLGGTEFRDVVDPDRVAEEFAAGATVVAQSLHRTHPKVHAFTERLGLEISHPLQANAYLTPPGATGLAPHADRHDVLVLQLAGSKCWDVEGLGGVRLGPGDTLYVPAGHRHSAESTDRTSLHLTVGILRVTYCDVLARVLRRGPSRLDDPLPLRYRDDGRHHQLEADLAEVIAEVRQHLATLEPSDVGRAERLRHASRPPRRGALTSAIGIVDLDRDDILVCDGASWSVTTPTATTVRVEADGRWLSAPSACRAALHQLSVDGTAPVGQLNGIDHESQLILARRLVTAGFCHVRE